MLLLEEKDKVGGGARSEELTLPGYIHDVCSAIHPMGMASPIFRELDLAQHGLEWVHPLAPLAHPMNDGTAVILERSLDETAAGLGSDSKAYIRLMQPLVDNWQKILKDILGPLPLPPRHPLVLFQFGLKAIRSVKGLANSRFEGERAKALFSGIAGHSILPFEKPLSAAAGLVLGMLGHAIGWPMARGGSQKIVDALASYFCSLGGEIATRNPVRNLDELPSSRAVLLDVTPRQLIEIAGHRLPRRYRRQLERFRYGLGVFKIDYALSDPIPWKAEECKKAGTVHLGDTLEEMAAGEAAAWRGDHPERPYLLLTQQSLFDPSRAPLGKHIGWVYCHVPNGSTFDMTERIEAQIERFAPGFRDCVLARHIRNPLEMEAYNPNYIGGDIIGGVQDIWQQFTRPVARLDPYSTPIKGVYLCSSSTPPGGAVHGMCGYHAARSALRTIFS